MEAFFKEGNIVKGVTHPYEVPSLYANNLPQLENVHRGLGEVIHLKYTSPEFSLFYDLLKIVDKDVVLGKAFLGISPFSMQIQAPLVKDDILAELFYLLIVQKIKCLTIHIPSA